MTSDKAPRAEYRAAEPGTTYLAFGAHVQSGAGQNLADDEFRPIVQVTLPGKWNHGAEDNLQVMLAPEIAEELAGYLTAAAAASRDDAERFNRARKTP